MGQWQWRSTMCCQQWSKLLYSLKGSLDMIHTIWTKLWTDWPSLLNEAACTHRLPSFFCLFLFCNCLPLRLKGLMPFSREDDHQTLVKVAKGFLVKVAWDFDDECFDDLSHDAMEFIEGLLVKDPRCVLDILCTQRVRRKTNHIWMELWAVLSLLLDMMENISSQVLRLLA